MKELSIDGRTIGENHPPFIVAEMSGNHNRSLERALEIVKTAAEAGAQALKLQTYTPDTMTLDLEDGDFFIDDPNSLWSGTSLYKLYEQAHTPWEWHAPIFERARELGMIPFSTPFDPTAVDFLEDLDVPAFKIASFENLDLPLIRKVAAIGKPVILSSGMATVADLDLAVRTIREQGNDQIVLLKCTSSYPAPIESANVLTIPHMKELFGVQVGLSDHTLGIGVAVASAALGATVIEKHFTLARADGGVDSAFSLEPPELKSLVEESRRAWQALGRVEYGPSKQEADSMVFRRSLYVAQDMKAGDRFTPENLRAIRPGHGLSPRYYELLLGRSVGRDVKRGTAVTWELVD
jgi:N-acetylneuraminate synthase